MPPDPPLRVAVSGAFDNPRSRDLRWLQEAARLGEVTVFLWSDATIQSLTGSAAKFALAERLYLLNAVRFVSQVLPCDLSDPDTLPRQPDCRPDIWADTEVTANERRRQYCVLHGHQYRVLSAAELKGFPEPAPPQPSPRKKVIVTGCYDWFHSGHVRFFEEVSAYGDLYAIVGHDANIRLLKGPGHPFLPQEERRYMVGAIRHVTQALISTGDGWLDAEPEIQRLKPDIYAVNEDGDRGGKREYCARHGIEYLVLKRVPAQGLPGRTSTDLRGF